MNEQENNNTLSTVLNDSKINIETKKQLIRLNSYVKRINKLNNYKKVEQKAYGNKNDYQKAIFELERIARYISQKENIKNIDEIKKELSIIALSIQMQKKNKKDDYTEILKNIIRIEVSLGMQIGLLTKTKELFYEELDRYYQIITTDNNKEIDENIDNIYNYFENNNDNIKKNKRMF